MGRVWVPWDSPTAVFLGLWASLAQWFAPLPRGAAACRQTSPQSFGSSLTVSEMRELRFGEVHDSSGALLPPVQSRTSPHYSVLSEAMLGAVPSTWLAPSQPEA